MHGILLVGCTGLRQQKGEKTAVTYPHMLLSLYQRESALMRLDR